MQFKVLMHKKYIFFVLFLLTFFISCKSLHQPKKIYEPLNYSEKDVYENEKKRIEALLEKDSVRALWFAKLLGDEELSNRCANEVLRKYNEAIGEKSFLLALSYYRSLVAVGEEKILPRSSSEHLLREYLLKDVPGFLPVSKNFLPKTIEDCINATVTVWVDRGISIKDGAGYIDRVIGSGFFIDERGYIITNHHVIEDLVNPKNEKYSRLYIKLSSDADTRIPAKVIGYDDVLDLALLKAEITPPFVLELGTKTDLNVGDSVSAIGTPIGLDGTLTKGIVSAVNRKLFTTGSVLQIDAAVNSGNSGGPLIDSNRKVQAVVFAGILQYQGLNFAIPVEYLRQDLPFLFAGGKRIHPWTCSFGHTKKDNLKKANVGLELQYSMPGGSTSRSLFSSGDVITSLNGINITSLEDMQDLLRDYLPGTIVKCTYTNNEKNGERLIYLEERPKNPGYEIYKSDLLTGSFVPIFGMCLVPSSTLSKRVYSITNVISGSIADESGFSENDPITVYAVKFNDDYSAVFASIYTKRKKKGFLDISLVLASSLDSPYYF
ncbi:MAG: serine protease [Treponema sp.]|nr:serine protease [Treponema sp.]